jgi:hypothetical protein
MWLGGALGFGIAIVPFFALSVYFGNKVMGALEPNTHVMLNRRRIGSMMLGIFFGALPGLAAGIFGAQAIGNAAGWNRQGYNSCDVIMLLLFAAIAALPPAMIGMFVTVSQEDDNKKEVLEAFSKWQSSSPDEPAT